LRARCILLVLFLVALSGAASAQGPTLEYAIKATYLYKFIPFVEWPAGAFASPESAFNICVVGDDPFGDILDRALAGVKIGDRPVTSKRLAVADRAAGCHVMFIGGSTDQPVAAALAAVEGAPILTVTDSAPNRDSSGTVNFVVADNKVRFEIDQRAAAANGLAVSAKLLSLAINVTRRWR
jgi:hypothetical protein